MAAESLGAAAARSLSVWGSAILGGRSAQEDAYHVEWLGGAGAWLLILCDGMGGHVAGATASQLATQAFRDAFVETIAAGSDPHKALATALSTTNDKIAEHQRVAPETRGMGTTLVAAIAAEREICWISVGDSPLWLLRGGTLRRLNEDHSLRGVEADIHISRNVLQSALTGGEISLIDAPGRGLPLRPGDAVVLASDGLHTLDEAEIAGIADANLDGGPVSVTKALLAAVVDRDLAKQDNCSVVVLCRDGAGGSILDRVRRLFGGLHSHALVVAGAVPASLPGCLT